MQVGHARKRLAETRPQLGSCRAGQRRARGSTAPVANATAEQGRGLNSGQNAMGAGPLVRAASSWVPGLGRRLTPRIIPERSSAHRARTSPQLPSRNPSPNWQLRRACLWQARRVSFEKSPTLPRLARNSERHPSRERPEGLGRLSLHRGNQALLANHLRWRPLSYRALANSQDSLW